MASVTSVNPGVSDLLQTLSSVGSTSLSSALSSSKVQSALQTASPGDLVQLSQAALQLQQAVGLFGGSEGNSITGPATPGTAAATTAAQEVSELLGTSSGTGAGNSPVNLLG